MDPSDLGADRADTPDSWWRAHARRFNREDGTRQRKKDIEHRPMSLPDGDGPFRWERHRTAEYTSQSGRFPLEDN